MLYINQEELQFMQMLFVIREYQQIQLSMQLRR